MYINEAKKLANYIKETTEFKNMKRNKIELEKNKSLKKQLDLYLSKKNEIYSKNNMKNSSILISKLNDEFYEFFKNPVVNNYFESNKKFNDLMGNIYKSIENELLKK